MSLRLVVALGLAFASCSRCGSPAAPSDQLTEKNTFQPVDRKVHAADGGAFTLTLPDGNWRVVADEVRARARPETEAWVVNPVRGAFVTVQCVRDRSAAQLEAATTVAAERAGRTFAQLGREALQGPWQQGVELSYQTTGGQQSFTHVDGLFGLIGKACAVQSWATDASQVAELHRVVRSFEPVVSPAMLALFAPLRVLSEPLVQAHLALLADAGVPANLIPIALVERGLPRLADEALDERFELRRQLLEGLPDDACAAIIAHDDDPALLIGALDRLTPAQAERWGALSVDAVRAEAEGRPAPPVSRSDLADAQRAYLAIDHVREAEALLQNAQGPAASICLAERTRLAAAFTLERAPRALLFRSWLAR